jgi:hypothetical protein
MVLLEGGHSPIDDGLILNVGEGWRNAACVSCHPHSGRGPERAEIVEGRSSISCTIARVR